MALIYIKNFDDGSDGVKRHAFNDIVCVVDYPDDKPITVRPGYPFAIIRIPGKAKAEVGKYEQQEIWAPDPMNPVITRRSKYGVTRGRIPPPFADAIENDRFADVPHGIALHFILNKSTGKHEDEP